MYNKIDRQEKPEKRIIYVKPEDVKIYINGIDINSMDYRIQQYWLGKGIIW